MESNISLGIRAGEHPDPLAEYIRRHRAGIEARVAMLTAFLRYADCSSNSPEDTLPTIPSEGRAKQ